MPTPYDPYLPTVEVGGKIMYEDHQGGLWATREQMIEANARREIEAGRGACPERQSLDHPRPDQFPISDR